MSPPLNPAGIPNQIDHDGTHTRPRHKEQRVGKPGPRNTRRRNEIVRSPQCGHGHRFTSRLPNGRAQRPRRATRASVRCSAKFGATSEIAQSAVVRASEPCAMPLVDFQRTLNLEFVLYVKDHPHSRLKPVAITLDVLPGAGDVEPEAAIRLCLVGVRIDPREFVVHATCQCVERLADNLRDAKRPVGFIGRLAGRDDETIRAVTGGCPVPRGGHPSST